MSTRVMAAESRREPAEPRRLLKKQEHALEVVQARRARVMTCITSSIQDGAGL
jgi:hypothetical protein